MPELAEVELFRRRWARAAARARILSVETHDRAAVFRGTDTAELRCALNGAMLSGSAAAAKQMIFHFRRGAGSAGASHLGIHLGMSGELTVRDADFAPGRHDHLVLRTARKSLVLNDPRMFGRVQFQRGQAMPDWWARIAPAILSPQFTVEAVEAFLRRRRRAPIKAVLLMQERFPGIGNWMADEILWRAALHPRQPAGRLTAGEVRRLWRECRRVCSLALDVIAGAEDHVPAHRNRKIPRTWLLPHRWRDGGRCPRTGGHLRRETVGGRTTCWSPRRQKLHR